MAIVVWFCTEILGFVEDELDNCFPMENPLLGESIGTIVFFLGP